MVEGGNADQRRIVIRLSEDLRSLNCARERAGAYDIDGWKDTAEASSSQSHLGAAISGERSQDILLPGPGEGLPIFRDGMAHDEQAHSGGLESSIWSSA